ncbi:MAG: transposase [Terracidiphilus sp.]
MFRAAWKQGLPPAKCPATAGRCCCARWTARSTCWGGWRAASATADLLGRLAGCFSDGRSPLLVKHQLPEMLAQRIYGLALGYEDLNDHEQLRSDPLLALLSGKRDVDEPLAGKPGSPRTGLRPWGGRAR